ncbi:MAG: hypothetical protein IJ545_04810 [Alphaproteobacteria bacterium]|nr:hypothetical protein [Alphaproteobacteria bacterium]
MNFLEALLVVFITLKLCGVITWRWLYVLSPLWFGLIVAAVVFLYIVAANCGGRHGRH